MKKTLYVAPVTEIDNMLADDQLLTVSQVGGNANIEIGEGEVPSEGDARGNHSIWDED